MYRLVFSRESRAELKDLRDYIARRDSARTAGEYMARLKTFCLSLKMAPYRGQHRPGIAFHQRTIGFERRVSIIFEIVEVDKVVNIVGIRYGGQSLGQLGRVGE